MTTEPGLRQRGGIPSLCSIWTLVVLVVLDVEQVLPCYAWQANYDYFLRVHPQRQVALHNLK